MNHNADLTIHNQEVSFKYSIQSAEPDVGVMSDYVEEWWPTAVDGVSISEAVADLLSSLLNYDDICFRLMEKHDD